MRNAIDAFLVVVVLLFLPLFLIVSALRGRSLDTNGPLGIGLVLLLAIFSILFGVGSFIFLGLYTVGIIHSATFTFGFLGYALAYCVSFVIVMRS